MPDLTIVGAGLLGCSFALAARRAGLFARIVAVEPSPEHAARALELGYVDEIVKEVASDHVVLLACPSDHTAHWLVQLAAHDPTIFDVASVKAAVLDRVQQAIGGLPPSYVPCHPIAGRENSGPAAADPDLFRDRVVIITPAAGTVEVRKQEVSAWWQALGAEVVEMDAGEHDRMYARTSHLPHLLAFAFLLGIEPDDLQHSGGGFRDFTRIGASDVHMWSAIFDMNRHALLEELGHFRDQLDDLARAIERGDKESCQALLSLARSRRKDLHER